MFRASATRQPVQFKKRTVPIKCRVLIKSLVLLLLLNLSGCSGLSSNDNASLRGTYWKLTEIFGVPVETDDAEKQAYLQLTGSGQVAGHSGCNQLFGQYQLQDSIIYFTRMASTRMACIGQADEVEGYMLEMLKEPKLWIIKGQSLVFFNNEQEVIARFKSVH